MQQLTGVNVEMAIETEFEEGVTGTDDVIRRGANVGFSTESLRWAENKFKVQQEMHEAYNPASNPRRKDKRKINKQRAKNKAAKAMRRKQRK